MLCMYEFTYNEIFFNVLGTRPVTLTVIIKLVGNMKNKNSTNYIMTLCVTDHVSSKLKNFSPIILLLGFAPK